MEEILIAWSRAWAESRYGEEDHLLTENEELSRGLLTADTALVKRKAKDVPFWSEADPKEIDVAWS